VPGVIAWVPTELIFLLNALGFGCAAVLVAWRKPNNRMWMVLSAAALAGALFGFTTEWAIYAQLRNPAAPAGQAATWYAAWGFQPIPTSLALLMFLYPTGHAVSRRWSRALWLLPLYIVTGWLGSSLLPSWTYNLHPGDSGPIHNPLAITGAQPFLTVLNNAGTFVLAVALALAIVSLIVRYRRGSGELRQQLKVFLFAGALVPLGFLLWPVYSGTNALVSPVGALAFAVAVISVVGMPLGIGIAIVKYRLYEIDVVISRTLVYGALAALITGVYVGIAVGIGELVGSGGRPNLGLSILATAIVAVGFQPARERLQRLANRLVYGTRATPYQVLSEFSSQVAGSYAADEVLPRMARVLQEGTSAQVARVWLRNEGQLRVAATWPSDDAPVLPVMLSDGTLPPLPAVTRAVEVRHQGELLGALTVTKRRGESLTPVEEKLLDDLAHQAGLVLKNVGLTADLQRRLEELRASRQRLVSAQDQERRRLERNLHDGAQQHLVALKVKLGLAELLAAKDPEQTKATLQQLKADTDEALETVRDLARGIYPPLLAEKGLATALESQARKATVPVTLDADGIGRYPQEVEATVYFCVLEALQNVQKYASASHATVRLRETDGALRFDVEDDGRGFDEEQVRKGAGLTNMQDRLDALDGALDVRSAPGDGCRVIGRLPLARADAEGSRRVSRRSSAEALAV
jgi:signal transduction histidine kinase